MLETKTSKSRLRDFNGFAFTSAKLEKGLRQTFCFFEENFVNFKRSHISGLFAKFFC